MQPSPLLRISPGRERKMETAHKRGRSLESSLPHNSREDDLVLFTDMRNRERDTFLLQSADDFDESISKLRYFPDSKLGITIPIRGESSDLLNVDGDKNDYDWLLTPPDTPLFPSLDDEEAQTIIQSSRERLQNQPRSISRLSTNERIHRSSRSSASPHRLGSSPCSGSSVVQSRSRLPSTSRSSPPPVLRPSTPSQRPTPPTKPSTPPRRSASPTPRRTSTGSGGQPFASGRRGTSPVKPNRGTSSSPKMRAWQSGFPGFSLDAPPNLRTSLSDRSVSRSRGLSPASASGTDSTSKFKRQSMSPTPSRSASSSHSRERDNFSSYSKASAASSCENDMDSKYSLPTGIAGNPAAKKDSIMMKSRNIGLSKKPSKNSLASSAPKRSFDSALWLMDHRKIPQNMFRPLLSSAPTTTFCVGKVNNSYKPMFSMNSSITTSSNASSEHGVAIAPYLDSDHDHNEVLGEWEKADGSDIQEEIFMFDKADELNEDPISDYCSVKLKCGTGNPDVVKLDKIQKLETTTVDFCENTSLSEVDFFRRMATCVICGKLFYIMQVDGDSDVCEECAAKNELVTTESKFVTRNEANQLTVSDGQAKHFDELLSPKVPDFSTNHDTSEFPVHQEGNSGPRPGYSAKNSLSAPVLDAMEQLNSQIETKMLNGTSKQPVSEPSLCGKFQQIESADVGHQRRQNNFDLEPDSQNSAIVAGPVAGEKFQQAETTVLSSLRVDNLEGAGISVLLQRSSSSKWPVLEGRAFTASNILCSEPYYARENTNAMKPSIGCDDSSVSSSVDLGSSRLTEARSQRHLSVKRVEIDKALVDHLSQGTGSVSDVSISSSSAPIVPKNETSEYFSSVLDCEELKISTTTTEEADDSFKKTEMNDTEEDNADEDCTARGIANDKTCESSKMHCLDVKLESNLQQTSLDEEGHPRPKTHGQDEVSGETIDDNAIADPQIMCEHCPISINVVAFHESCEGTSEKNVLAPERVSNVNEPSHQADGELSVMAEGSRRQMQRSFTLEEATDTILFCSSIIHDLAYKAATLAMENAPELPEPAPWPTLTISSKAGPKPDDLHKVPNKRTLNPHKVKRKRPQTDMSVLAADKEQTAESSFSRSPAIEVPKAAIDSVKPPKLESKCNCTIM